MSDAAKSYYRIRIQLDPQPEGGWTITSPDVPGLVTEADVPEEIEANVQDALGAFVGSYGESPADLPPELRPAVDAASGVDIVLAADRP